MPVNGRPKFDTIVLGHFRAEFMRGTSLEGKAAFADSRTGATHGFTNCNKWSKTTMELLAQLRASMEEDIAMRDFDDVDTGDRGESTQLSLGGLGEHLSPTGTQL